MSAPAPAVELRLPSRLGFEKVAMSTAASLAALMGFEPDRIEDLKTAISEACINAKNCSLVSLCNPIGLVAR